MVRYMPFPISLSSDHLSRLSSGQSLPIQPGQLGSGSTVLLTPMQHRQATNGKHFRLRMAPSQFHSNVRSGGGIWDSFKSTVSKGYNAVKNVISPLTPHIKDFAIAQAKKHAPAVGALALNKIGNHRNFSGPTPQKVINALKNKLVPITASEAAVTAPSRGGPPVAPQRITASQNNISHHNVASPVVHHAVPTAPAYTAQMAHEDPRHQAKLRANYEMMKPFYAQHAAKAIPNAPPMTPKRLNATQKKVLTGVSGPAVPSRLNAEQKSALTGKGIMASSTPHRLKGGNAALMASSTPRRLQVGGKKGRGKRKGGSFLLPGVRGGSFLLP